tara:strand:- start:1370 stop:1591 length:222 start_codon:yes stop_codon:yes gene_type:complete
MKLIKIKIFIIIFLTVNIFNNAHAYLDPGTGAFILQALAVILASIITFFTFFINKVKSILSKIKKFFKKKTND